VESYTSQKESIFRKVQYITRVKDKNFVQNILTQLIYRKLFTVDGGNLSSVKSGYSKDTFEYPDTHKDTFSVLKTDL